MHDHPYTVIGMIGRKQSGKDTAAELLVREHGFTRVAFADPLREAALDLDPIVHVEAEAIRSFEGRLIRTETIVSRLSEIVDRVGWERAKEDYPEVRRTLQRLGTEVVRHREPDFWTRRAAETIRSIDGPVVVTDLRFPNEVELISHDLGGHTVRVTRPGQVVDPAGLHSSETALDATRTTFSVVNDGTIAELHAAVRNLVPFF